jgi:hypothetical protein
MMLEELQRRNLSKLTAEYYLRAVEEFARFFKRPPDAGLCGPWQRYFLTSHHCFATETTRMRPPPAI